VPDGIEEAYEEKLELELLMDGVLLVLLRLMLLLAPGAIYMRGMQLTP